MAIVVMDESAGIPDEAKNEQSQTDLPSDPLVTLFAVPKAFDGHTAIIQRNAIQSWCQLRPNIDVFLLGDDPGVSETAEEFGIRHFPDVNRNEHGTPLLDHVFRQAIGSSKSNWVMYVNSDIMLGQSFIESIKLLGNLNLDQFLAIGQRTDFDQEAAICFDQPEWEAKWLETLETHGTKASILCKDFFLFPGEHFKDIPAFSIGRGNWDNWMVSRASKTGSPVIDLTDHLIAGHQNHDYIHAGGRMKAYVTGDEAQNNKKLAGGTNYIGGSVATHRIDKEGNLKRISRFQLLTFLWDMPRISRLVYQLFRQ